jgi:glycerol-3-phosphate dehydrogenase
MKLADIIDSMNGAVAEGVLTSRAAHDLAKKLGVEAPIIDGIHKVIHGAYEVLRSQSNWCHPPVTCV